MSSSERYQNSCAATSGAPVTSAANLGSSMRDYRKDFLCQHIAGPAPETGFQSN